MKQNMLIKIQINNWYSRDVYRKIDHNKGFSKSVIQK